MLPSQVVERCQELGASSARLISGSMEDMAFAKQVVEAAEAELGTSAACSPPASGRLEMLELSSTLLFVACPLRKIQYLRRKTQEKWGWGEVCPNSAPCSPALPLCPACTAPAQAELRSQFHLGALVTSCPSLTILDFITAGYCGLKPPVRPATLVMGHHCGNAMFQLGAELSLSQQESTDNSRAVSLVPYYSCFNQGKKSHTGSLA